MSSAIATERPHEVLTVPSESAFPEHGYMRAAGLDRRADDLMDTCPELLDCRDVRIAYYWKQKGGQSAGKPVLGKCQRTSGVLALETGADYIIWLAADHLTNTSDLTIEASLYHEMCHVVIEYDEKTDEPKLKTKGHDAELFISEIQRYGAWRESLAEAAKAITQLGLFEKED